MAKSTRRRLGIECPILWEMVDELVEAVGKGVIKELLLDRGFLDGAAIGKVKTQYDIDVTIGVKRNMNVFEDALALANLPETQWESYTRAGTEPPVPFKRNYRDAPRPEHIKQREATRQQTLDQQRAAGERPPVKEPEQLKLTRIKGLTSWSSCPVPLDLVVCCESKDETLDNAWGILTTKQGELKAVPVVERYHFRIHIEERHRHLKCFWDLTGFSSPCFSLVVNQIIFTVLTYSLLQQQIFRQKRKALNKASKSRLKEELIPVSEAIIVYVDHYYAIFDKLEYTGMVLDVPECARQKLRDLLKRKRSETLVVNATSAPP